MTFKMEPFPCPECGHHLLVDVITTEPQPDGTTIYVVKSVIDDTTFTDPELRGVERAGTRILGRHALVGRLRVAEAEVARLDRLAYLRIRLPWRRRRSKVDATGGRRIGLRP